MKLMRNNNKQYYFATKMKLEEKEREKHNLEVMKSNEDFYRQHIVGKKDDCDQFADTSKVEDNKVKQENKQSFLGYPSRTAFCKDNHIDKTTLKKIIEQIRAKDECLNLETILKQREENIHNCQKFRFKKPINDEKQEIKDNNTNNLPLANSVKRPSPRELGVNYGVKSHTEDHNNNVKTDNIVIELEQIKKEISKNRNRIKGLDWYFEKKLTKLMETSKCSLDTKINFVQSQYIKGIYRILALGLLYILTNDIVISILKLIK